MTANDSSIWEKTRLILTKKEEVVGAVATETGMGAAMPGVVTEAMTMASVGSVTEGRTYGSVGSVMEVMTNVTLGSVMEGVTNLTSGVMNPSLGNISVCDSLDSFYSNDSCSNNPSSLTSWGKLTLSKR